MYFYKLTENPIAIISYILSGSIQYKSWMVDATFIFILLFISSYFRSVWHPVCFILCYLLSRAYTFSIMFIPHCKYFFLSSCTRNMAHNAVNTRPQSLLHRTCTCTSPVRQMPFGVTTLKIEDCVLLSI